MVQLLYKVQTRFLFHANIRIKIPDCYDDSVFDELYAVLEEVDKKMNSYREGSSIDRINRRAGHFVEVDNETIQVLREVLRFSVLFDGTYDITIMPLIRLWGFYNEKQRNIPSYNQIKETQRYVNYRNIEIEGNNVRIGYNQEIITGSFLKSYAVDKLIVKMRELGITDAVVNAGGSTIATINNKIHPAWDVNVRHPETKELLYTLPVANQCYSTSSQLQTFVDIRGRKYGHILNPLTGYPAENRQIGIISNNCMTGDIISTALFSETPEGFLRKMELLSLYCHVEGYMLDDENHITCTKGFKEKIITKNIEAI